MISKVSSTLHTPLMSGANAIHGIILLGAVLVTGTTDNDVALVVGLVAIVLAAVNMVGGFVVTDRMLQMFVRKKPKKVAAGSTDATGAPGCRMTPPIWVQLVYLACAVCFILALKGLSGPDRPPRQPGRRGRRRGRGGDPVLLPRAGPRPAHARGDRGRHGRRGAGAKKVQMTQMPQMVALFNGVGGGAAALVALLELTSWCRWPPRPTGVSWFVLAATASRSRSARSRSPGRSSRSPSSRS